ncbi:MAG: cytochrome C peroxidase [Bacteroidetes bacterium]|nr:cytochrome C peroxidase [Bacteroidota bacterium]
MRLFILFLSSLALVAATRLIGPDNPSIGIPPAIEYFTTKSKIFAASCTALRQSLQNLTPTPTREQITIARQRLIDCRLHYKQIESFLEYFFRSSATIYNRPPKYEAEEPTMEYQAPIGLQLIESLLYEPHPNKKALLEQASAVESSASDLPALLYEFKGTDPQLLESLRLELIRIIALDITGYEAPLVKTGIRESATALQSFASQLQPFLQPGDSISLYIEKASTLLQANKDFDSFDRLTFLKDAAIPLQRHLALFIREKNLYLNTFKALNYDAGDIFNPAILKPAPSGAATSATSAKSTDPATITLGRQLFFNPALSKNQQKSCASCHNPTQYFTDGRAKSLAFDNHHSLDRNAPSLLYSAYQYSQFWDGRVRTLEDQILTVLHDPREMNADTTSLSKLGGIETIVTALAAYVRSLHPQNSPFDQYLNGNLQALNPNEIKGANLFLGKAQCATCHFIPLFNGLIPPYYEFTEYEALGTTTTSNPPYRLSPDPGKYKTYPLPFLKGAFKTPTVRNSAKTAPYMHNGAFPTLESLIDFYNKGGGAGLGLKAPDQTLPATPLHLTKTEEQNIILFIHTLTDNLTDPKNPNTNPNPNARPQPKTNP